MSSSGAPSPDGIPSRISITPQATPTPPITNEQQSVPFQMPPGMMASPFFANPFMSPFMPQQGVMPDGMQGGPNPATMGGFYFSPAQYQEMMQQYFQQMMAANASQYGTPFPMQQYPGAVPHRPSSQASQADSTGGESTSGGIIVNGHKGTITEQKAGQGHNRIESSPSHQVDINDTRQSPCTSIREVHLNGEAGVSNSSVAEWVNSKTEPEHSGDMTPDTNGLSSEHGSVRSEGFEELTTATERKTSLPTTEDEKTTSLIKKQMNEIEKEISRRSHNKNIKKIDDQEMAELIGSSSVVSVVPTTVPAALDEQAATFTPNFPPMSGSNVGGSQTIQAGMPYTPPPSEAPKVSTKETLNQLRSSFNLPEGPPTASVGAPPVTFPLLYQHPVPMHQQVNQSLAGATEYPPSSQMSFMPGPMMPPYMGGNPMMAGQQQQQHQQNQQQQQQQFVNPFIQPQQQPQQSMPFSPQFATNTNYVQNGAPHFTPEQLAAAFAQQLHVQSVVADAMVVPHQAAPSPSAPIATTTAPGGLAPPPAPAHPVQRKHNEHHASTSDWPEEIKENGSDEPVWVLRDSYLKRLQREERGQEADWQAEASAAAAQQETVVEEDEQETDRLLLGGGDNSTSTPKPKKNSKETMVHEPAVLIEGVLFRAKYLGSTQMMCESRGSKAARMAQAQEAVARVKAPEGEIQPSTEIDLFISTEKIMVLNTDLQRISDTDVRQDILMDHALRTISYIADIGDLVVLMARRMSASSSDEQCNQVEGIKKSPKVICHVFESDEASFIAQSIGQAFQVAYVEFLRANGIDDPSYLRQIDYQEVLNSQELLGDELEMFARKETQKDVVVPKKTGESLGIVVVESGWGSMLPTVVLAHMNPAGPAARSNQLNIGDQIININGISLVGLPLSAAQNNIKNAKTASAVRLTIVSTPPVVEVRIRRPDTKYQLGFSVQNGVICSLLRGGIAERGGIRVGHRIIEINNQSVVAVAHDRIVNMLATAIGEIHMKTMPTSMFRLLTGQEKPEYI